MLHSTLASILSTKHRPHHSSSSSDEEHIVELGISISTDQEMSLKEAEKAGSWRQQEHKRLPTNLGQDHQTGTASQS